METTSTTGVTTASVGFRYGLLIGLVSILLSFIAYTMHWQDSWTVRIASTVVMVGGLVLAQREFKQRNGGFMSYGEGIGVGVIASCVVGALTAVFLYVYITMVSPEVLTQMVEKARSDMEAKGTLSDEQIDQAMALSAKFMKVPFLAGVAFIGSIIWGLIISLITSAFVKNAKPEFE